MNTETVEKYLHDLSIGQIKADLKLHEPDSFEDSESFTEENFIELSNDCNIGYKFTWSYSRTKGMKGDYLTPDDPDSLTLDYLDVEELTFFDGEDETDYDLMGYPKIKSMFMKFVIGELSEYTDDVSKSVWKDMKGVGENRLYKFDEFVNESKKEKKEEKEEKYTMKDGSTIKGTSGILGIVEN